MKKKKQIRRKEKKKRVIRAAKKTTKKVNRTAKKFKPKGNKPRKVKQQRKVKQERKAKPKKRIAQQEAQQERHPDKKKKLLTFTAASIILVLMAFILIFYAIPGGLTGYTTVTKEMQQTIDYNQAFSENTETLLEINNIIGLKISGKLEGAGAKVKLTIDGTEYIVADIKNVQAENLITGQAIGEEPSYALTTDKTSYLLGETATLTLTPDVENKSFYVSYGEQTQKLETSTYTPTAAGEYQAVALVVLADDILRLETNFTFSNETTPTETPTPELPAEMPPQTPTYEFTDLCLETCTITETSNPTLIVELQPNSTLTITQITITQNKENSAPEITKNIPDITQQTEQTTTIDLNEYFSDPDGDTVQYDINEIPEIEAQITQNTLTITSTNPGIYTAYIYATDGDKLVTSNTFTITVSQKLTEYSNTSNITITEITLPQINETINQTINETNQTISLPEITTDVCSNPDVNQRPSYCFVGIEDQVYQDLAAPLENRNGALVGRFNKFGNLIIKGLLIQEATGEPGADDFKIGYTQTNSFIETRTHTAWISQETGNLYLRGKVYEEQEILQPPQFDTYIIQNKFGIVLAYFNEKTGDLYLKGNVVQLGKI